MKLLTSAQNKVIIRNECSFAHFDDLVRSVDNNKTDPKQKKKEKQFLRILAQRVALSRWDALESIPRQVPSGIY